MEDFSGFGLPDALTASLKRMNYATPTPIQAKAIPLALAGHDILGSAQTGTGKTAAFAIPMIARLLAAPRGSALVLSPTRELAVQILDIVTQLLGPYSGIRAALVIGGESMPAQAQELRMRPRIIIGTPGRINDHLERGSLMLNEVTFLVLDETDRMLDMGFAPQLDKLGKYLTQRRQTLMFSATLPDNIMQLASKYLSNPQRVAAGGANKAIERIQQEMIHTTQGDKYNVLLKELNRREGSVIIFVKTKHGADKLADKLSRSRLSADVIHGDLTQRQRELVIQNFRDQKHRILVATDIASRGLDIPHIEHVINYDLPQAPEDYIHRIGRTARAGAEGHSLCLIAPEDDEKWRAIQKLMGKAGQEAPKARPQQEQKPRQEAGAQPMQGGEGEGADKPRRRRRRGGRGRGGARPAGASQSQPAA